VRDTLFDGVSTGHRPRPVDRNGGREELIERASRPEPRGLLAGRRAVVTAAAGTGIGFATARRIVEEGASIVVSDRHERRLEEAATRLRAIAVADASVHAVGCDVTDGAQVEHLFARAVDALDAPDLVVLNAGLGHASLLVDTTDAQWHRVLDVTLHGTFRCLRAALRHVTSGASIVTVGSVTAQRAERAQSAYAAAKAGVHALTRCAALEVAGRGVRVNAIAPTLAMHPFLARAADADHLSAMQALQPQGRAAEPVEIADVILFLASELSGHLTGECISVSHQKP
jgi:3-oxoacyl-[acyl-carrier protein] reductase